MHAQPSNAPFALAQWGYCDAQFGKRLAHYAPANIGISKIFFFGPSDTKLDYSDRQAAFDRLYSPRRMETRFHLFEHMVLPGFRAQTDPDFKLVVLSSAIMPEAYRTRLTRLCASLPR